MIKTWTQLAQQAKQFSCKIGNKIQKDALEFIDFYSNKEVKVDERLFHVEKQLGYIQNEEKQLYYFGELYEGKIHGQGILIKKDKFIYIGDFYLNQQHGLGAILFFHDQFYFGQFSFGSMTGVGLLENKEFTHCGNFINSTAYGLGIRYNYNKSLMVSHFVGNDRIKIKSTFNCFFSEDFKNKILSFGEILKVSTSIPKSIFEVLLSIF